MHRVYTGAGDKGDTGIFGGKRVSKASPRISAGGSVDELNSAIGLAKAFNKDRRVDLILERLQKELFYVGADVAAEYPKKAAFVNIDMTENLEKTIDELSEKLPPLERFILPDGDAAASALHLARAIARRTERDIVALSKEEKVNQELLRYMNRISSLLFILARLANKKAGMKEVEWRP